MCGGGVLAYLVKGRFEHVNFIWRPAPLTIRVTEVIPPHPPKLLAMAEQVVGYDEDLPPVDLTLDAVDVRDLAAAHPAAHYLLPFAARSRFLFKMDFAEAQYIARLRSGVKGHFSYRQVAWEMKLKMEALEPELGRLMEATPPWVEDPLKR